MSSKPINDSFDEQDDSPEHIPVIPIEYQKERLKEEARKLALDLRKKSGRYEPVIITKNNGVKKASELSYQEQEMIYSLWQQIQYILLKRI
jgi:hypothetical protein